MSRHFHEEDKNLLNANTKSKTKKNEIFERCSTKIEGWNDQKKAVRRRSGETTSSEMAIGTWRLRH
jgi:hypothetical protein